VATGLVNGYNQILQMVYNLLLLAQCLYVLTLHVVMAHLFLQDAEYPSHSSKSKTGYLDGYGATDMNALRFSIMVSLHIIENNYFIYGWSPCRIELIQDKLTRFVLAAGVFCFRERGWIHQSSRIVYGKEPSWYKYILLLRGWIVNAVI
jgi:hypothetical protein